VLINGIEATNIDAMDRGLAYGDGLFSTIKVQYGQIQLSTDKSVSVLKIILTRGSGGRGYSTTGCDAPQRIISTGAYPDFYQQWQKHGIQVILCESQLASNKQLAGLKTLNRLEQVLIKKELESKQAVEGIVCDNQGVVIEACSANLFIYLDNRWQTPKLDSSGVAGVQRRHIIDRALQAGFTIEETYIHIERLKEAQAICLSNALMGIVPVNQYQQTVFGNEGLARCRQLQFLIEQESDSNEV